MRAYPLISRRVRGKTTEYCKCDLSRSGKRTQIKKEDGTGDGSRKKWDLLSGLSGDHKK